MLVPGNKVLHSKTRSGNFPNPGQIKLMFRAIAEAVEAAGAGGAAVKPAS